MINVLFKRVILFSLIFYPILTYSNPVYAQTIRIAIMPFVNISEDKNYDWLSQGFSESLTSAFAQTGKLVVIERNQIKQLLKEQSFQKSGLVDEKNSIEIGKILGVDKLIVGSYQIFSGNISVNSRVVNIQTAQIDTKGAIANKRAKLENIFDLQEELCVIHSRELIDNLSDNEKKQISQVTSKSTNSLTAYEYYVKGREQFQHLNPKSFIQALEYYNKALDIDKNYALVFSDLAQMYGKWGYIRQQNGQEFQSYLKQALNYGQQAVNIAPNIGASHKGLGIAYYKNANVPKAKLEMEKAIELNPNDSESYFFMWNINHEDENSENIKKSISLNPAFAPAYNELGNLMQNKKEYSKAIEYYQKALEINPGFAYAYMNIGNVYTEIKNFDKAIDSYQKAIEMDPDFSFAYVYLGNAYRSLNKLDDAVKNYQQAIKINPDFVHAYNNLGNIYHTNQNYQDAINNYQQAIKINPEFNTAYYNLGLAYEAKGDKVKAVETYNQYLAKFPYSPQAKEIEKIITEIKSL